MACAVCKKSGHDRRNCPLLIKNEESKLELALTERRYLIEGVNAVTALLQNPIMTAGVWFMMSRSNATLGVLNKAILTSELTPLLGDIKFPEGVILGAAMESTEDLVDILHGAGLLDSWKDLKKAVSPATVTQTILDVISPASQTCEGLYKRKFKLETLIREGPTRGGGPDAWYLGEKELLTIEYTAVLKRIKEKCEDFIGEVRLQ